MHREVTEFYKAAKDLLDPSAEACLGAYASNLLVIRSKAPLSNNVPEVVNKPYPWAIHPYQALLTKPSRRYEKGKRRGGRSLEVVGRITATWAITSDAKKSDFDVPKQFRLIGNASVAVELVNAADFTSILRWNVDVAAPPSGEEPAAPGCMIHVQIENPSRLPVPRLPTMAFTPLAVAEFVLSELFQDDWPIAGDGAAGKDWAVSQQRRMLQFLEWQRKVVSAAAGSPWSALKRERVPSDLFLPKK